MKLPLQDWQAELAARSVCEQLGLDPDKYVAHEAEPGPDGYVPGVCLFSPQWTRLVKEIQRAAAIRLAMVRYIQ